MGQALSFILRLLPWNWKLGRSQRFSDREFYVHFDDDQSQSQSQSQSQLTLPVHAQEQEQALAESCCVDIDIIIDHSDPSPDLPTSDGLLSAPSSDHNNQITTTTAPHINTNNITKTRQEVASDVVTTLETVLVTRRIGPYTSAHKILLVGEGDFSFSACLAVAFGSASNMVATSLNSLGFLLRNYQEFSTNKIKLVGRGCIVLHGIDATQMATHPQLWDMKFDRIVYNFPLAGFRSKGESTHSEMRRHQKLVSGFLRSAKQMINENGQIHVRHKCNGFFLKWNIPKLASDQGLFLIQEAKFQCSMFPGYHTKYGFGGDKDFECHPSKTYMFGS